MPKAAAKKPDKKSPKTVLPKAPKGKWTYVPFDKLLFLPELQMRVGGLNQEHVENIRAAAVAGAKIKNGRAFKLPDGRTVVTDGFHTGAGYKLAKRAGMHVLLFEGTWLDAVADAAAANQPHLGLPRTNKDKRRAVEQLLDALAVAKVKWSARRIAEQVGVGDDLVSDVRKARSDSGLLSENDRRQPEEDQTIGSDGRVLGPRHQAPKASEPAAQSPPPLSGSTETAATEPHADDAGGVLSAPAVAAPDAESEEAAGDDLDVSDWRAVPLAEFLKAEDWVWQALGDAGVSLAGETLDRILKGDSLGLGRGDLDNLRTELEHLRAANEPADPVCQAPAAAPPEPKAGPVVRDAKKRVVPAALAERFAERRQFYKDSREVLKQLLDAVREERKEPESAALRVTDIEAAAAKIDLVLEEFTPYVVCPHVQPTGLHPFKNRCLVCKGTNFVQAGAYIALTAELKQIVAEWAGRGAA